MNKQIYQQAQLPGSITTDNSYFVIDMLDPVSNTYKTYRINPGQLADLCQKLSGCNCVHTIKTSLTSAQILLLNSNPQVLVPAAGAGTILLPLSTVISYTYSTAAYATNTNLQCYNNGLTDAVVYNRQGTIITQTANHVRIDAAGSSDAASTLSLYENQSLMINIETGNPTAGDGTLVIYTTFIVLTA